MKAVEAAFNQEKALVGAFSVIVKTDCETDGSFYSTLGLYPQSSVRTVTIAAGVLRQWRAQELVQVLLQRLRLLGGGAGAGRGQDPVQGAQLLLQVPSL